MDNAANSPVARKRWTLKSQAYCLNSFLISFFNIVDIHRSRRDLNAKQIGEEEKRQRSLQVAAASRELIRNPLRYVPDLPGFHMLEKTEVVDDLRNLEKNGSMAVVNQIYSE